MLHRHSAHNEALARIGWCIAERRIGDRGTQGRELRISRAALHNLRYFRPQSTPPHDRAVELFRLGFVSRMPRHHRRG
jgi:hypothetical protein